MRFLCLSAVQTIEKANALAEVNATRDIFIASVYQITEKENWDLGGKIIHRYKLDGYGIYNLFCYFNMFPTAKAGRHLLKLYRKKVRLSDNIFMVQLAEKLVRKLDFEQKEPSMISAVLSYNGVNYSAAIYLFSRLLMAACGIILSLPLVFIGVRWWLAMCGRDILFTASRTTVSCILQYGCISDELKKDLPVAWIAG